MEIQAFSILFYPFITFTISFSLFSLVLHLLVRRFWCNCENCSNYLSSRWSKDFNSLCDWYTHLLQNSPTQTIHIHVLGNTITANPDNVERMLKTRFDNYPKGKTFSTILGDLLGKGIFNVDGDLWRFQRKMSSLELSRVSMRKYAFDIVTDEIKNHLIPILSSTSAAKDGGVLDLQDVFQRLAFDNICRFSFGLDPNCLESSLPVSAFAESFHLASKLSAQRAMATLPIVWKIKRFFNIGSEKKLKNAIKVVHDLANEVIMQKRKLGHSQNQDLLSRFMDCTGDDLYLRDIVISFILAGRDTMASALTTLLWLLANHPNVVSKILNEANQIMSPNQDYATHDQIKEMHYLHATVFESLRLYPPVQFDSKFAENDDVLSDGTFVKKGTRVTYHPYAMGRIEKIWGADCEEFKPERWINQGVFTPESPFKCPVFQGGVRVCLGKEMALVGMKIVALSVVSRFEIQVAAPKGAPRFEPGLTTMLSGGLQVLVRERNDVGLGM